MSVAGTYNMIVDQGSTFTRSITYNDSAGNPINLTGYTAKMQVRETIDSATVVLELSTTNGRIALGGVAGTISLTVPAANMNFASGQYAYDLELTSAGGVVTRIIMGSFVCRGEVTR